MVCLHIVVSGRVQGVFFRASTQEQAIALGLGGWVRNCSDGTVEVMVSGAEDALEKMQDWLWKGPQFANVDHVKVSTATPREFDGFEIR